MTVNKLNGGLLVNPAKIQVILFLYIAKLARKFLVPLANSVLCYSFAH